MHKDLIVAGAIIMLLSGCGRALPENGDSWKSEIAEGHACGEHGLECCKDREPKCFHGLICCTSPDGSGKDMCLDECACGKDGSFCCEDEKCQSGLVCLNQVCEKCGKRDEPCCDTTDVCVSSDLACSAGRCVLCGIDGNPCCMSEPACIATGTTRADRNECRAGTCMACGSDGMIPCEKPPVCNPGNLLNNGSCLVCGGFNQPCCASSTKGELKSCDSSKNLECRLGFCS